MHQIAKDITGVGKTEVQLVVAAPVNRVWDTLIAVERWPEHTRLIASARWNSEEHWTFGSSFKAQITWPILLTCTFVVTGFKPTVELRWVTHAIGMVIERWTRVIAHGNITQIDSSAIYFAPSNPELPGELGEILPQVEGRFFGDLKCACEGNG
jgi:hypothetical protein